jgi:hypothetical protein
MEVSGELHAPDALPRGKSPRYPLDWTLVGPRVGVVAVEKRKMSFLCRESNPFPLALHSIGRRYNDFVAY